MADFDLLENVEQKFVNTVVMFEKRAAIIKGCGPNPENPEKFVVSLSYHNLRNFMTVALDDPALNYKDFRIGYVNGGNYCTWWYRKPHKQWSQGLKSNQMGYKISANGFNAHDGFSFTGPFIKMLENDYLHPETIKKNLIDNKAIAQAFHRDFALSYDDLHNDFIIEYHGTKIGVSQDSGLKQFKLIPDAKHLVEALQEARNVHG